MQVIVDSILRLPPNTPVNTLEAIRRGLTFKNPEYIKRARLGLSTYGTSEEVCLLRDRPDGWHELPRGADSAALIRQTGDVEFIDCRIIYPKTNISCTIVLRTYQNKAANALIRNVQGIVQAPCGAGKTVIGVSAIARAGQPALVLVNTRDLVDQWQETLSKALQIPIGILADGEQIITPATVATIQTLATLPVSKLQQIGKGFGTIIVDEAHHVPAETFTRVLACLPGKYRWGLTATPTRADGLTPILGLAIGPVVASVSHKELVEAGHLVRPSVQPIRTDCAPAAEQYSDLIKALMSDKTRTAKIIKLASGTAAEGRSTLVLSTRVAHCQQIAEALLAIGCQAEALNGRTNKKKRKDILDRFRSGELRIMCATNLADEGLDVSRLEALILALPSRSHGRTIQRLGRLMRPHPGKREPVLFDLVDDHPLAKRQWYARKKAYQEVMG